MKTYVFVIILSSYFLISCEDEAIDIPGINSVKKIGEIPINQVSEFWTGEPRLSDFFKYDVTVRRVTYETLDPRGNPVVASGAILLPKDQRPTEIISLQHATFFADEEAPSENGAFSVNSRKALFASAGYAVLLPDYIGYGATKDLIHPYFQKQSLAQVSLDFLTVGMMYLEGQNLISSNPKIHLAGYSEGAYASLALANQIENEIPSLEIGVVSLGSGAYDLEKTFSYFLSIIDEPVGCLTCNAFFIRTYQAYYFQDLSLDNFFRAHYGQLIANGLLDGEFDAGAISSGLPPSSNLLFDPSFLEQYPNGQFQSLQEALHSNNIREVPAYELLITHGDQDRVAPIFNSREIYSKAQDLGVAVTYEELEERNHFDGILGWAVLTLTKLEEFGIE